MIINGDSLIELKKFEDNSVDSIVTDPPYGISFMAKKWDYDVPQKEMFAEILRVLKPGGHMLCACGTRTQHRMAVNIEDAGFEIRDVVSWIYGSGFPKSHNIGKAIDKLQGNDREVTGQDQSGSNRNCMAGDFKGGKYHLTKGTSKYEGWGTALKPAQEFFTLARKPLSEKTIAQNVLKWGTGGINIDGCRVTLQDGEDTKRKVGGHKTSYIGGEMKKNFGIENQADRDKGRFPANLIHDGSQEVMDLFPVTKSGTGAIRKNAKAMFGLGGDGQPNVEYGDKGSAARFFYCAKASKRERNEGLEGFEEVLARSNMVSKNGTGDLRLDGKPISKQQNTHPTVKPIKLMQYLCRLITPEGGTVLDPFMGSGSTGVAAKKEGFDFIGIELDEDYCKIAEARINNTK